MIAVMIPVPFDRLPDSAFSPFRLERKDRLFAQGATARALVLVETGALTLLRTTEAGHGVVIGRAGPGEILAEASLTAGMYHCDCIAAEPTTGQLIAVAAVRAAMSSDPEFAIQHVARLARHLLAERQRIEIMSIRSAPDRVHAALLAFGQNGSITDMAQRFALTQEACSRALARLVADGRAERVARGRYRPVMGKDQGLR